MKSLTVTAAELSDDPERVIDEMNRDDAVVMVSQHGKIVAVLVPLEKFELDSQALDSDDRVRLDNLGLPEDPDA